MLADVINKKEEQAAHNLSRYSAKRKGDPKGKGSREGIILQSALKRRG
jgi:hypothetical protein